MPNGTVEAIGKSRTGKPTVTIGGQVYSASQCNPPTTNLQVGDKIEFESASSVYNGATVWFLNSFRLTEAAVKYPSPGQPSGQNAAPAVNGTITEGERLTISNWVAAAITSGLVKDPADMGRWAHSACDAIRSAGKFTQEELDDKIPFSFLIPLGATILGAAINAQEMLQVLTG